MVLLGFVKIKKVSIYWWLLASATEVGESVVSNLKETMKTTKESQ